MIDHMRPSLTDRLKQLNERYKTIIDPNRTEFITDEEKEYVKGFVEAYRIMNPEA